MILPALASLALPSWAAKAGIYAAIAAALWLHGCHVGKSKEQEKREAERAAIAAQAAKQELENAHTEKLWLGQLNKAEAGYAKTLDANRARAATELGRLRESAARSRALPGAAEPTGSSAGVTCATRDELLRVSEAYVDALAAATGNLALARSCLEAWPK